MAKLSQILTEFWPDREHSGQDLDTLEASYEALNWIGPGEKPSLDEIKVKEAQMDAILEQAKRLKRQLHYFRKVYGGDNELEVYYALTRAIVALANKQPLPPVFDKLVTELQVARSVV